MRKLLVIFLYFPIILFSQTIVDTIPQNKNILLEEYHGIGCWWCSYGNAIADSLNSNYNSDDFVAITIHSGSYAIPNSSQPDYRTSFGDTIHDNESVSTYPSGSINRHVFPQYACVPGHTHILRDDWGYASNEILLDFSPVNIGSVATIDLVTGELIVDVELYYTDTQSVNTNYLNVAIIQNNIIGPQEDGGSGTQWTNNNYEHNNMLRYMMTGYWGDTINTISQGTLLAKQYNWMMPTDINGVILEPFDIKIVVFVNEDKQETLTVTEITPTIVFVNSYDVKAKGVSATNAICGSTTDLDISFMNYGNVPLTSLDIDYSINGSGITTFNWVGNLLPAEDTIITILGVSFNPLDTNTVDVNFVSPSGNTDQNISDNNDSTSFIHLAMASQIATGFVNGLATVEITTDNYPEETTWKLIDDAGVVIGQGGPYITANTTQAAVSTNLNINECYSFLIYDTYGDGLGGSISGRFIVNDASGNVIASGGSNFTFSYAEYFEVTNFLSITESVLTSKKLLKTVDFLGRESNERKTTPLFYIYNDGTVEKRIIIE